MNSPSIERDNTHAPRLVIRPSTEGDIGAITAVYAHAVNTGTGTFELEAPDVPEMTRRRAEVLSRSLPFLVAERGGSVVGYAYANYFRPRMAYRFPRTTRRSSS